MAKTLIKSPDPDLYETDYHRWLEVQADLLREGRLEDIDAVNLIEEFDEFAVGERASVESHTETVIEHLLKLQYSPAQRPRRGWRLTVRKHRARLKSALPPRFAPICYSDYPTSMPMRATRLSSDSRWIGCRRMGCPPSAPTAWIKFSIPTGCRRTYTASKTRHPET